jgi:hypothetical protein
MGRASTVRRRRFARNRHGKDFCMVRLRNVLLALVVGTGATGCSFAHWSPFHCDHCDDFPAPAYGPDFSMMPGSYTGTPPSDSIDQPRSGASALPSGTSQPSSSGPLQPVEEAPAPAATPPTPASASARTDSSEQMDWDPASKLARSSATVSEQTMPRLFDLPRDDIVAPTSNP